MHLKAAESRSSAISPHTNDLTMCGDSMLIISIWDMMPMSYVDFKSSLYTSNVYDYICQLFVSEVMKECI